MAWHMILGDRKLSLSWKGLLKKVTRCLLVVDVVLDHDESCNNLFVWIYIVFKVVLLNLQSLPQAIQLAYLCGML